MPVATFRSSLEKAMVALERRNDGWTSKTRRGEPAGSVPSWKAVSANCDGRPTITAIPDRAGVPYSLADFIAPQTIPPARGRERFHKWMVVHHCVPACLHPPALGVQTAS